MEDLILMPMDISNFDEAKMMMEASFEFSMKDLPDDLPDIIDPQDDDDTYPSIDGVLDNPKATPLVFYKGNKMVGGAVLAINDDNNNSLDILFVNPDLIDNGIGYKAWLEIEKRYPQTKTWNTVTPTCLMRNVFFYVNKCGFHIIKVDIEDEKKGESMFVFQKTMK